MKKNFFTDNTKVFLGISAAIVVVAIVMSVLGFGMNLGIDFTGGSLLSYSVGESYDVKDVESILSAAGYAENQITKAAPSDASIALVENAKNDGTWVEPTAGIEDDGMYDLQIRLNLAENTADEVRDHLETEMTAKYPNFEFISIEHVSAVSGADLLANAIKSMLIVFVCLLIYIGIRFDLFSGLATLAGLLHDVLIMCAFMVFFRGIFQVNSAFIAALLTIVGYSINNTIVVFDRIREVAKRPDAHERTRKDIVEEAVSKTLTRTINTSLTTLFTLVTLFVFGVDSIREFAFPLIVGMLAGTYSSVLLSGQIWAFVMDKRAAKKQAKA